MERFNLFCRHAAISRLLAVVSITCIVVCQRAVAVNTTWTFNGDGNWTEPAKWSAGEPTNNTFDVFIDDDVPDDEIDDIDVTVTLSDFRTVGSLTIDAGDALRIHNTSSAMRGLTSARSISNDGSFLLASPNNVTTYLSITDGTLTNGATGLFHFEAGAGNRRFTGNLVNQGEVRIEHSSRFDKSGGVYRNEGQFSVSSGDTLTIENGGAFTQAGGTLDLDGTLDLPDGSTLDITGGVLDLTGTINHSGTSVVQMQTGGVLNMMNADVIGFGKFALAGGTLNASGFARFFRGTFDYRGGTINGTPRIEAATLIIGATATEPASFLLLNSNTLAGDVHAGQSLTVESRSSIGGGLTSATGFTNNGTVIVKSGSSATTWFRITSGALINSDTGVLHFQQGNSGTRLYQGNLTNHGSVIVEAGAIFDGMLEQAAGTFAVVDSGFRLTSGSEFRLTGGTLDVPFGSALELGPNSVLSVESGTLNYTSINWLEGHLKYLGGTITGTTWLRNASLTIGPDATGAANFILINTNTLVGDVHAGQVLNFTVADTSSRALTSANGFTNNGAILMTDTGGGSSILHVTEGTLTNGPTGVLHFQAGNASENRYLTGDLVNHGTVIVDRHTFFNKSGGTYTNHGVFDVNHLLEIHNGVLTNFNAGTLTGGTYDVASTFRFPDANIVNNNAEIIFRHHAASIRRISTNTDALANLAIIGPEGALRLFEGRNFTATSAFTNEGELELDGTTFKAPSLTNAVSGQIIGFGTVDTPNDPANTLVNNGLITGNSAEEPITLKGYVTGDGAMNHVVVTGTLSPGPSTATVNYSNVQYEGTLHIEIGGSQLGSFDQIVHSGAAALGGMLDVDVVNGFIPAAGNQFEILTATAGITGVFSTFSLPELDGDLIWNVVYASNSVLLRVAPNVTNGDFNGDGKIDAADYVVWRKNDGSQAGYDAWRTNFGRTAGSGSVATGSTRLSSPKSASVSVPEPAGILIVLPALIVRVFRRRPAAGIV